MAAAPQVSNTLVINEVYAPSSATPGTQFFELYNLSNTPIDLSSYVIYNSNGTDPLNGVPITTVAAHGTLTISASNLGGTIGSGLNPAGDFLALVQRGAQDTVIDVVNWGVLNPNWTYFTNFQQYFWPTAPTMPTDIGRSLQRYPTGYDTDQPSDWVSLPISPSNPPPTYTPTNTPLPSSGTPTPTATGQPFCRDAYEPDGIPAQAKVLVLGTEQTHVICNDASANYSGDDDFMAINVTTNKVYTLYTKDLGPGLDTILAVYNSDGVKIGENDDAPGSDDLHSQLDISFTTAGTYFVRVRDNRRLGGLGWVYTVGFTSAGTTPPTATLSPTPTQNPLAPTATPISGPCLDAYEPDGVPATAHLLLIGEVQPGHTFCPGGDADWYKFFAGRGKAYTISTYNLGIGVDTYLYLFDSDGTTVLAQNDDATGVPPSGSPNDVVASSIDFFPVRDDFYYIMVKNKGDLGSSTMTYNVSQKVRANVPPPAGTPGPVIAPVVTVTSAPPAVVPPTAPRAAAPPVVTDTPEPTGTPEPTATEVPPGQGPGAGSGDETPTPVIEVPGPGELPTEIPIPLPQTGHAPDVAMVAMPLQVYVDANGNSRFDKGEGVHGLQVSFRAPNGSQLNSATTGTQGAGSALLPRNNRVTVSIPYLRWSGTVTATANGLLVRLPRVALPARIP
jgi:hypothetical protein